MEIDFSDLGRVISDLFKKHEDPPWSLTITRIDNGYILQGIDFDAVIEEDDTEKDDLRPHERLLFKVMEYFNFQGSKHDEERLSIVRTKKDK